jgi:cytoskeletal protein CcmA (bactofilin family)
MLRKKETIGESAPTPSAAPVHTEKATVIGENLSFEGGIKGKENLVIQGSVKGEIDLDQHHLAVGPKGRVEADIHAANVTVSGRLTGNISASEKVAFSKEADFTGEVKAKRISVEDGAYLKAVIELQRDSDAKAQPAGKPAAAPAAASGKSSLSLASDEIKGK